MKVTPKYLIFIWDRPKRHGVEVTLCWANGGWELHVGQWAPNVVAALEEDHEAIQKELGLRFKIRH